MMIQGPIAWAKIIGKPQPGYDKLKLEWSFDLGIDAKTKAKLEELGVGEYVKPNVNPKNNKNHVLDMDYIKFSRREIKVDGSKAQPFKIVDENGKDWPEGKMIGNGSIVNVKFATNEKQSGGLKPSAIALQVWDYKAYEGGEDFPSRAEGGEEDWTAE